MVLCDVDDVLTISHDPMKTIEGIKIVFKLKNDAAEPPEMYLGATLEKVKNSQGVECWSISSEKYVKAAVENVEEKLDKSGMRLPSGVKVPMSTAYHPSEDISKEMDGRGVQYYLELIGVLRWAIEIGRVDILLEVSLLSSHLDMPRIRHL